MAEKGKNDKNGKKGNGTGSSAGGVPPPGPPPPPPPAAASGNPAAPQDGQDNGNGAKRFKNLVGLTDYFSLDKLKASAPPAAPPGLGGMKIHPFDIPTYTGRVKPESPGLDLDAIDSEKEYNRALIQGAYLELIRDNKRPPTFRELSDRTGLKPKSIREHLKNLNLKECRNPLKVFTPLVLLNLTNKALDPDANDGTIKLWLQVVAGYVEKAEMNINERVDFRQTLHNILEIKSDSEQAKRLSAVLNAYSRPDKS